MNQYIDHTLLKPEASKEQIKTLCEEAMKYQFKSVCINPTWVSYAHEVLKDSEVMVCTVIGFPLGASSMHTKAFETVQAISDGADEIDMVMNIGAFKSGEHATVLEDIQGVVEAAKGKTVKVILETCLLSDDEITRASELSIEAGAHFIKTSTGFNAHGATKEAVVKMLEVAKGKALVKASGGVRSFEDAKKYIDLGVKRLGTSSGVAIMEGTKSEASY